MREGDAAFEALRAAIDELAAGEAEGLIAEARIEARAKVRSILAEAIAQALLEHSSEALSEEAGTAGDTKGREPAGPGATPGERSEPVSLAEDAPTATNAPEVASRERVPLTAERGRAAPDGASVAEPAPVPAADRPPPAPSPPPSGTPVAETPAAGTAASSPPAASDQALGWYVYCVVSGERLAGFADLDGVTPGRRVVEIPHLDIAVLASAVPLAEYAEERLRENLNDVGWLEETARAHEGVLELALAETTVIPMRLCTVYASERSVREMLERERPVFVDALSRLEGKTEWGVKVFVERRTLDEAAVAQSEELGALRAEVDALAEGEAYMKRRQLETLAAEEADLLADACVDDVHGRLAAGASEALLNPLQRPEVSGHDGEMLLNGVYLVEDEMANGFHATVSALHDDYAALGFTVELTGPWPPYNFVGSSIEAAR